MADVREDEIEVGLVLRLDPDVLEQAGGTYTGNAFVRVQGWHLFLCIEAFAERARWIPLFSRSSTHRSALPKRGRSGHEPWLSGTFNYHYGQIWSAPHSAVVDAAEAGRDPSTPGGRNWLRSDLVPRIR